MILNRNVLTIPPWSDSNKGGFSDDLSEITFFQSHHGLILTSRNVDFRAANGLSAKYLCREVIKMLLFIKLHDIFEL